MKPGWQKDKLGDVCSFLNRGISPKYLEEGGICVLNQKCVRDHRINFEQARRHDHSAKVVSADRFIQLGDVLINSTGTGTLGRVAQIREAPTEPTTVDSHITIARAKANKFYSDFFGYMLVFIEELIKEAGEGCGGQTELARSVLAEKFHVSYPNSITEQQRIVAILDEAFAGIATAIDNAELNLANARELFESYLQSLIAHSSKDAEIRQLGDASLLEIIDGDRGTNYPKSTDFLKTGHCLFLNTKNVRPDGFSFDTTMFISKEKDKQLRKGKLMRGDVVMTTRGTIGNIGYFSDDILYDHIRMNSGMLIFRPNQKSLLPSFLFEILRSEIIKSQIRKHVSGAAQPQLPIKRLVNFVIPIPNDIESQRVMVEKLRQFELETQRLEALYQKKLKALDELKKSILHQAFSGQL